MTLEKGTIAFTESELGEFPTKLKETPIPGASIRADFDYTIPKKKGRPKGSKNKPKSEVEAMYNEAFHPEITMVEDESVTIHGDPDWVNAKLPDWYSHHDVVPIKLQSSEVEGGLEALVSRFIVVVVSELPNGNASLVTNIGSTQPLILVTAEPYAQVKDKLFPGVRG